MRKRNTFKMPNRLICDDRLSLSARKLAAVLYARCNVLGYCHKSLEQLAALAGCSISTVRKNTQELEQAGWITSKRTYIWSEQLGRRVYGKKEYRLAPMPKKGWTVVPRDYLTHNAGLEPSTFVVGLYLYVAAGNRERRAYPSISKIAAAVGVAARTVCRALHQIRCLKNFLVTHCKRVRGDFTANNYHLCVVLPVAELAEEQLDCVKQRTTKWGYEDQVPGTRLHAFILRLRKGVRKLFSGSRVMTFLANKVKT